MPNVIGGSIHGDGPSVIGGSIGEEHHYEGVATPAPVRTYAQTIGDGVTTVFAITHNLGTLDTQTQVYNPITGLQVPPTAYTAVHTSANVTTLTFTTAPAAGAARAVIEA
jgi:hypothetical protein